MKAAIVVEASLRQVRRATASLSHTDKRENFGPLRNWIKAHPVPLYVVLVFYDQACALSLATLDYLMGRKALQNEGSKAGKLTKE